MSDKELKTAIISALSSGSGVACTSLGHSWTVVAADQNSITLRDPQWEEQVENKVWAWEEFRSTMVKFTSTF